MECFKKNFSQRARENVSYKILLLIFSEAWETIIQRIFSVPADTRLALQQRRCFTKSITSVLVIEKSELVIGRSMHTVSLLLYRSFILCTLCLGNKFGQSKQSQGSRRELFYRSTRCRKIKREIWDKFNGRRRGKRANGSALPPRLTDWKENPSAIRSQF